MTAERTTHTSPAAELSAALKAAREGHMPPFDTRGLLAMLRLDTPQPDGLELMDRLKGDRQSVLETRHAFVVMSRVDRLIKATNERVANPAQEVLAQSLGQVISRQVVREGDICPGARAMMFDSKRPDIIPDEIKASVLMCDLTVQMLAGPEKYAMGAFERLGDMRGLDPAQIVAAEQQRRAQQTGSLCASLCC